ncbi:MAG: DUF6115 domain-containing protein [Agathobacter sp.]|nr:DUF6115 domain-containing protein [Agathobacter sp.]
MTIVEITLIIIGIIFLIGSFMVKDKLSAKDINYISQLSEKELGIIVSNQLKKAENQIVTTVNETIDETSEITKRELEKETNEKIMAISQYSDTVLESMNKSHNEIMFLYSMLNDKHKDLTDLAVQLQEFSSNMKKTENEILGKLAEAASEIENNVENSIEINESEVLKASVSANIMQDENQNHNMQILSLHAQGASDVEIAKQLGLGLGEVKLVLGLYKGEA